MAAPSGRPIEAASLQVRRGNEHSNDHNHKHEKHNNLPLGCRIKYSKRKIPIDCHEDKNTNANSKKKNNNEADQNNNKWPAPEEPARQKHRVKII